MLHIVVNETIFLKSSSTFIFSSYGQNSCCVTSHKSYILIPYFESCHFCYESVLYFFLYVKCSVLAGVFKDIPPSYGVETFQFY